MKEIEGMSNVIGIQHDGIVTIGGDSAIGGGPSLRDATIYKDGPPKVWKQGPYLVGGCGVIRALQAVRYLLDFPDPSGVDDLMPFLIGNLIPPLREVLLKADIRGAEPGAPMGTGSLLLGIHGELWEISADLGVFDRSPYTAIGSGYRQAEGALHTLMKLGVTGPRAVEMALEATASTCPTVVGPWTILSSTLEGETKGFDTQGPNE
jgi:hypothetical protein